MRILTGPKISTVALLVYLLFFEIGHHRQHWQNSVHRSGRPGLKDTCLPLPPEYAQSLPKNFSLGGEVPIIPTFRRQNPENLKSKASIGYIENSTPTWAQSETCLKINTQENKLLLLASELKWPRMVSFMIQMLYAEHPWQPESSLQQTQLVQLALHKVSFHH